MENVKLIKKLGKGVEGETHVAEHKEYGLIVIKRNRKPQSKWSNEANILGTILNEDRYHYVTHLYEIDLTAGTLTLMLKYCDSGDLKNYLKDRKNVPYGYARMEMVRQVQLQLGAALVFLHTGAMYSCKTKTMTRGPQPGWNPVVHRDIKPANILLSSHEGHALPDIILGDFGMAITQRPYRSAIKGSPENIEQPETLFGYTDPKWSPPEYRALRDYYEMGVPRSLAPHPSYDIWQFGAVLHYMTAQRRLATDSGPPWIGSMYERTGIRAEIVDLLEVDPESRPTDRDIAERLVHWHQYRDDANMGGMVVRSGQVTPPSSPPSRTGSPSSKGSLLGRPTGKLGCPRCTFDNFPSSMTCYMCGTSLG
jgi:serine/threonine protein kinase